MLFETISSPNIVGPQTFLVSARINIEHNQSTRVQEQFKLPSALVHSSTRRQLQFLAGRHCMSEAIKAAYCGRCLPEWTFESYLPNGLISSTTQTSSFVSAAVSFQERTRLLGIDSECIFTEEALRCLWPIVLTKREVAFYEWNYRQLMSRHEYISLIFSAKQSLMKAFSPFSHKTLGFQDFLVTPDESGSKYFNFEVLKSISHIFNKGFHAKGLFDFCYDHVHTAVELTQT